MRKVLLHYHLFKNAGSSIDRILRESYGDAWCNYDKTGPGQKITADEMTEYLEKNPVLKAVSSHQVVPPVPNGNLAIFPIVFIREPIDRVRSAWMFEWQKQPGLKKPKGSLAEYVEEKLAKGRGSVIANFQVFRLANQQYNNAAPVPGTHELESLERAVEFLGSLPFFGIVDRFEASLDLLRNATREDFPDLKCQVYRENASQQSPTPLKRTYNRLKKEIGQELYDEILLRNRLDLQLYSYAQGLFDERTRTADSGIGIDNARSGDPFSETNSRIDRGSALAS